MRIVNSLRQKLCVFEIPTLILYIIFHHGKKDAYIFIEDLTLFYFLIYNTTQTDEKVTL